MPETAPDQETIMTNEQREAALAALAVNLEDQPNPDETKPSLPRPLGIDGAVQISKNPST